MKQARTVSGIAREIREDWVDRNGSCNVNYAADPYLKAMDRLHLPATRAGVINQAYGADSVRSVILYFLSNAASWRGETARRIKAELKEIAS